MGEVICTDINIGSLPPCIHGMKVLPTDMNDVWALEVDIGYYGGAVLDVETRLEVRELDFQRGSEGSSQEAGTVGDVSADILEEFKYFGKQLNLAEGTGNALEHTEEYDPKLGEIIIKLRSTFLCILHFSYIPLELLIAAHMYAASRFIIHKGLYSSVVS